MIERINAEHKKKFLCLLVIFIIANIIVFCMALMIGHYGFIDPITLVKAVISSMGLETDISRSSVNIVTLIRFPRTLASFLVGGALAVAGLVYQNTFNNKLVSPDILGVSSGCCVGAGIAILMGMNGTMISILAFVFGFGAVILSLLLPKLFKNKSSLTLVLSGIIVGSFGTSIIGLLKYLADRDDKLAELTFWMMGSVSSVTTRDDLYVLPIVLVCFVVLVIMSMRIDIVSFGRDEAQALGINYKANRLIIVGCSTLLTAASVSISGNVGWVGLVVPHIARALVGNKSKESLPIAFLFGSMFMMFVDMLARTMSHDEVPLSIITGILGGIIYTIVLMKKGRMLNE